MQKQNSCTPFFDNLINFSVALKFIDLVTFVNLFPIGSFDIADKFTTASIFLIFDKELILKSSFISKSICLSFG